MTFNEIIPFLIVVGSVISTLIFSSLVEWFIHYSLMHKWGMFDHAEHHIYYPEDNWQNSNHGLTVDLPLWSGLVTVGFTTAVGFCVSYFTHNWAIVISAGITAFLYFCTYKYVHTCFHIPQGKWFEKTRLCKLMVRYHKIHHTNKDWDHPKNICVVFPIADWFTGTGVLPKK